VTRGEGVSRLRALGLRAADAETLWEHFDAAERAGKASHGHARIGWLETQSFDASARPRKCVDEPGYERWSANGSLGYLAVASVVGSLLEEPPPRVKLVVVERCFPTGMLGDWARRLAVGGLVSVVTATSPRRLSHPSGGQPLTGTNPLAIAIPSSDGMPFVTDVSMGAVTHGDVLAGRARPDELVPFGQEHRHKAFALAAGLELFVGALAGPDHGAVILVARSDEDPVPAFRALAGAVRLPGDSLAGGKRRGR
jgi:LDH2 family malate/lactate/ureidoglycolate dehydrogenase